MRWWWFGPAVTKPELARELRAMKDAGIGGVELQPVYPLALDDPTTGFHNQPYLSNEFLDNVRFAAATARELGLRFDLTLGSGWPYGGRYIPVTEAAGKLRVVSVPFSTGETSVAVPYLATSEKLLAAFASTPGQPTARQMLDLSSIHNGRIVVNSQVPATVTFFISSRTGMMVKRPALGAEGFVLDHFDHAAIETHLHMVGERLMTAFGSTPPYSVFSDSLEVNESDWTPDLLQQFRQRRGYDLTPYLPALVHDIGPQTAAIRHDWGETLTELINENYLTPLREWAAQHGTRFRSQTYGIPSVSLSSNRLVDLPEGEGDDWRAFTPTRWASSASHLYQRNITSSETWTWLHSPPFRATPLDMKADADRFFLEGVNQIVGHGWPYSRPGLPEPGWHFYAAGAFDDHNPWWPVMPEVTHYFQRISFLLRQGQPVNDVALLLPTDDAWAQFHAGSDSVSESMPGLLGPNVIPAILNAGFNFDFIDAQALENGKLAPYRILILPGVDRLPLATYQKIEDYAQHGGIVIATRSLPSKAPGLTQSAKNSPAVRAISQQLFQNAGAKGYFVEDERELSSVLDQHLTPDVSTSPQTEALGFVHRRLPFSDIYFLVNTSNRELSTTATFRSGMKNADWLDPFTGEIAPAGTSASIKLDLQPYQSRVLVFSNQSLPATNPDDIALAQSSALTLANDWTVTFPGLHRTIHMQTLHSWADDADTRFYSGPAIYAKNFDFSIPSGKHVYLDFGAPTPTDSLDKHSRFFAGIEPPIREAASISLNGQFAGDLWKPPYRLDITRLLHQGANHLSITVYNSALNEMAGRALPDYRLLDSRYGRRFSPQDSEDIRPLPSGLLNAPQLRVADRP